MNRSIWRNPTCRCVIGVEVDDIAKTKSYRLLEPCPYHNTPQEVIAEVREYSSIEAQQRQLMDAKFGKAQFKIVEYRVLNGVETVISERQLGEAFPSDKYIEPIRNEKGTLDYKLYNFTEAEVAELEKVSIAPKGVLIKKEDDTPLYPSKEIGIEEPIEDGVIKNG